MKISCSQLHLPSFPHAILYFHPIISKFSFKLLKMNDAPPHAPKAITFPKKQTNKQLPLFGTCFSGKSIRPSVCAAVHRGTRGKKKSHFWSGSQRKSGKFIRLEEKWSVELVYVYLMGYFEEVIMRYDRQVIFIVELITICQTSLVQIVECGGLRLVKI